jgi:CARDB
MLRRAVAAGAALLAIVLLVWGVNGCLDARKDRAYRDYAADVRAIVDESNNLAGNFFETLSRPRNAEALDVQNEVNAQATDAEQLLQRARGTDHPDELNAAQSWIVASLEFRRDALKRVAQRIPAALGERGAKPAINSIAAQMQMFLASDVIYSQRATPELKEAFADRDIDERLPTSRSLPDLGWLDPSDVETRLGRIGSAQRSATPGAHGSGLEGVTVKPSGTALSETGVNRIAAGEDLTFDVAVQNQGESEETDVGVSVSIRDGRPINLDQTISRIAPGDSQTVSVPITPTPETGAVSEVTVEVAPVPGERVRDNNKATYQVVFTKG